MAGVQGLKRRMRSVRNTRQITKALQLVSASKLRRAQAAALGPRDYVGAACELLQRLSSNANVRQHPLYDERPVTRALTIVVAGDRGMAGAYNANVFKALATHIKEMGVEQDAICVGRHAASHILRLSNIDELAAYSAEVANPDVELARPITQEATELFIDGQVDAVHVIYTHFVSSVQQQVMVEQLLPVVPSESQGAESELEPNPDTLLDVATRRVLEAQLLQAILDAEASEQAARMLAMMNATNNAGDLIDDLNLAYNNARQAAITQELAEITGGAEAISNGATS